MLLGGGLGELGWFSPVGAGWEHTGLIPHRLALEDALDREEQVGAVWGWGGISGAPSSGTEFLCRGRSGERRREMELRNCRLRGLFSPGRRAVLPGAISRSLMVRARGGSAPSARGGLMCLLGSNCSRERARKML